METLKTVSTTPPWVEKVKAALVGLNTEKQFQATIHLKNGYPFIIRFPEWERAKTQEEFEQFDIPLAQIIEKTQCVADELRKQSVNHGIITIIASPTHETNEGARLLQIHGYKNRSTMPDFIVKQEIYI